MRQVKKYVLSIVALVVTFVYIASIGLYLYTGIKPYASFDPALWLCFSGTVVTVADVVIFYDFMRHTRVARESLERV